MGGGCGSQSVQPAEDEAAADVRTTAQPALPPDRRRKSSIMHGVTRRISEVRRKGSTRTALRFRRQESMRREFTSDGTLLPHEVKSDRHLVSGLVRTARRPRARPSRARRP